MYLLLYVSILLVIILLTKIKYRTIIKSNILFTGMWCVCAGISSLGLYELYKPSNVVHLYSITTIATFNIVFFSLNNIRVNKSNSINLNGTARLKLIYIANIISWIYLGQFIPKVISIIASYGLRGLRDYAYDSSMGLATTIQLTIIQCIIQSVFIATILIAIGYTSIGRKAQLLIIIAIIDVALYTFMFGGRYLIVKTMMYYICGFLIIKSTYLEKFKKKKINVVFIGIIIATIIVLTSQRNWGDTSFFENTVVYYVGSFSFLDDILKNLNWSSSPLFGMGTLGFIINLAIAPFTILFQIPYIGSDYLITQITAIPRFISPTQNYNAMTTMLYPFLRDFGYIGIIIGTSFLAWFISFAEKMFVKTNHLVFLCLYVYLAFILFDSVMTYQLLSPGASIVIGLLFVFIKFEKRLNVKKNHN